MRYPKELWDDVNEELYGHMGNSHEAIIRYCVDVCRDADADLIANTILRRFGLE